MAFLFTIEGKAVYPNAETLLISPFKEIWDRDKSKHKEVAIAEFTYIEFLSSSKKSNPFRQYPENKKREMIKKNIVVDKKWKPDALVEEGIKKIIKFQEEGSSAYTYYMSAKKLIDKMKKHFDTLNVGEKNVKTGNPLYKPADITRAIIDTEKVLSNFKSLENKVEEELYDEIRTKGNKEISIFAKKESLK